MSLYIVFKERHSPICIDISPIAHVALLHTDINSGFKFVPSMGMKSAERRKINILENYLEFIVTGASESSTPNVPMHGLTCWKQALVRSPSRANELWRTSGILSWTVRGKKESTRWDMQVSLRLFVFFMLNTFTGPYLHALVHEGEDIATSHQLLNGASQSFCQSTKKIQSHNHEVFVRGLILFWLGLMKLENITWLNLTVINIK